MSSSSSSSPPSPTSSSSSSQNPSSTGSQGANPKSVLASVQKGSDEVLDDKTGSISSGTIVYAIVENQRGVLHRVSSMFRAKGFNITSISIGRTSSPDLARMTIAPAGDEASLALLVKQLRKMIDVIEVGTMTLPDALVRELALVKFEAKNPNSRRVILDLSNALGARTVDSTHDSLVVEFCSTPEGIDSFIQEASRAGAVKELVRTGLTALRRE